MDASNEFQHLIMKQGKFQDIKP